MEFYTPAKSIQMYIVCLSLQTMINLNQMHEVLLFVCSKMTDETNLSSKLPVADKMKALMVMPALAFQWACFCLALLILSALYSPAPLLIMPCYFARSCAICSHDCVGMLVLKGKLWGVLVSLLLTTTGAFLVLHWGFSLENVHQAFW